MDATCPDHFIALAERLADCAGDLLRRHFRATVTATSKADRTPVSEVDWMVEQEMRAILRAQRPEDGVIGEEFDPHQPDAPYVWVIDPLDGTKAFLTGRPLFGCLVALLNEGRPILGVIDQPIVRDRWIGAAGRPTTHNARPIRTRACAALGDAVIGATAPEMFDGATETNFRRLAARCRFAVYGGDCIAYGLLASGFQDLIVESGLQLYDFAALVPVVVGAGGRMTDWRGNPLDHNSDGRVIAAGDPRRHADAIAALRS